METKQFEVGMEANLKVVVIVAANTKTYTRIFIFLSWWKIVNSMKMGQIGI